MPVRSLSSPVLKWPGRQTVDSAVRAWAKIIAEGRKDVLSIGYFGFYARGDWGVGSDLDIILILEGSDLPVERRATEFDATPLPVPADLLVYTVEEWRAMKEGGRFCKTVMQLEHFKMNIDLLSQVERRFSISVFLMGWGPSRLPAICSNLSPSSDEPFFHPEPAHKVIPAPYQVKESKILDMN
jgi:predicted nucleotidyltransferase